MPFNRPALKDLRKRTAGDIEASLKLSSPILAQSVLGVIATVLAGGFHSLYGFAEYIAKQLFPETAEGVYLELIANRWGIYRKQASYAAGQVTVFSNSPTAVLSSGTVFSGPNNLEYTALEDARFEDGSAVLKILSELSGDIGNLPASSILTLINPIAGVSSEAKVTAQGIAGGVDTETDEDLRARLIFRIQNPPMGGTTHDYIRWATSVPGVTRAWAYENYMGPGTVGVTFVEDNKPDIIPDQSLVYEVAAVINSARPLGVTPIIFAPLALVVNFTIHVNPDTDLVRNAIKTNLIAFIKQNGYPGNIMYLSQISAAVSSAAGEEYNVISSPVTDIAVGINQIALFGEIVWN